MLNQIEPNLMKYIQGDKTIMKEGEDLNKWRDVQ